jgi:hypothetical protein
MTGPIKKLQDTMVLVVTNESLPVCKNTVERRVLKINCTLLLRNVTGPFSDWYHTPINSIILVFS